MPGVDDQVVSMKFDNSEFEGHVQQSLASLDKLRQGLDFSKSADSFKNVEAAANNMNLDSIGNSVDNISSKFGALGAIGFTVLQDITNGALQMGASLLHAVIDPIVQGGNARSLAIEQAKFQFKGLGENVDATMASALAAVKGTAYGLDQAATLAGVFGTAGITAGAQLTGALRGVAGVAAITGSRFQDIGQIFQNMAALGHVTNQDLRSLALRGVGEGKVAQSLGITVDQLTQGARDGTISFATFAAAMDKTFGAHAKDANKTFTGALANMHAALARIGADVADPKFRALRNIFNALSPVIDKVHQALTPLIDVWKHFLQVSSKKVVNFLGGIDTRPLWAVATQVGKIFNNIKRLVHQVIVPIKSAFRDIFPESSVHSLVRLGSEVQHFTKNLHLSLSAVASIRSVFSGVFSVVSIVWTVFKGIASVLGSVIKGFAGAGGGVLFFGGKLGDALTRLKLFLVDGGRIHAFFADISGAVSRFVGRLDFGPVINVISNAFHLLGAVFDAVFHTGTSGVDRVKSRFGGLGSAVSTAFSGIGKALGVFGHVLEGIRNIAAKVVGYLKQTFGGVFSSIADDFKKGNFSHILDLINVGLLGGLVVLLKRFVRTGVGVNVDLGGIVANTKKILRGLTVQLNAMQTKVKAEALLKIAEAVGILTASVFVLSLIDSGKLTKAMAAMAVGFGQLVGAFAILDKLSSGAGALTLIGVSTGLIALSVAMLILSFAVKSFSTLSWGELAKGLVGLASGLLVVGVAAKLLEGQSASMAALGFALIPLAAGLTLLAGSIVVFGHIKLKTLGIGLLGIAAGLTVLGIASNLLGEAIPLMFLLGVALIPLAFGLTLLAGSVVAFGHIKWGTLGHALAGFAGSLTVIGIAAAILTPVIPSIFLLGIALVPMAIGLDLLAASLVAFGHMKWGTLGKGLAGIASGIIVVGVAALAVTAAIPSIFLLGIALIPLGIGLEALARSIKAFGDIKFGTFIGGLLAMLTALLLVGSVSAILGIVSPLIAALGISLILVGAAFLLFAAAAYLGARAFQIFADSGAKGSDAVIHIIENIITMLPKMATAFAQSLIQLVMVLANATPKLTTAFAKILGAMLDGLVKNAPKMSEAIGVLIDLISNLILSKSPELITAGFFLLTTFLSGLNANIGQIATSVAQIIVSFTNAMTANLPSIITAGTAFIIALFLGIGNSMAQIAYAGALVIISFINGLSAQIGRIASAATSLIVRFLGAIGNNMGRIINAGVTLVVKFINGIGNAGVRLANAGLNMIIKFVNGLAAAIRSHEQAMREAGLNLAGAIIDGMTGGLASKAQALYDKAKSIADHVLSLVKLPWNPGSPSRTMIELGHNIIDGFAIGLSNHDRALTVASSLSTTVLKTFNDMTDRIAVVMASVAETNPTISPVLDLSQVEQQAGRLGDILSTAPIAPVSFGQASAVSGLTNAGSAKTASGASSNGPTTVKFEQVINSPKELSVSDIYRQTQSQISLAKKELAVP